MNSKIKLSLGAYGLLLVVLSLSFQNCSNPSATNLEKGQAAPQKNENAIQLYGNGEGYGGKLDGVYASVDARNKCGQATASVVPVKEQIEIKNQVALKTIENCKKLNPPVAVDLSLIQASSLNGQLMVLGNQIFEKADWVSLGFAPRDQYVDVFCQGEDPLANNSIKRTLELSVYKNKDSLFSDLPWNSMFASNRSYVRKAELVVSDQDRGTAALLETRNLTYQVKETTSKDINSGGLLHQFEMLNPFNDGMNFDFDFSFTRIPQYNSTIFTQMSYSQSSSGSPLEIPNSACWSNR